MWVIRFGKLLHRFLYTFQNMCHSTAHVSSIRLPWMIIYGDKSSGPVSLCQDAAEFTQNMVGLFLLAITADTAMTKIQKL